MNFQAPTGPENAPAPSIRIEIRDRTKAAHDALDRALEAEFMGPKMSLGDYRDLLKLLQTIMPSLENHVHQRSFEEGMGIDLSNRRRAGLIKTDLITLGESEQSIAEMPVIDQLPDLPTKAHVIGALYVPEGSTLGS